MKNILNSLKDRLVPQPENPLFVKVCSRCSRIRRYTLECDPLGEWVDLTALPDHEIEALVAAAGRIREHHTICPDCRKEIKQEESHV